MSTLIVTSTFFVLSLVGAVVLFRFFKSAAIVKTKTYQAGGAIAGFIIIYALLYGSYANIEKDGQKKLLEDYETIKVELQQLRKKLEPKSISGTVEPFRDNIKVVLAVKEIDTDNRGKFRLKAPCIDPEEDDVRLFIMTEEGSFDWAIYSEEEMKDINIPISNNGSH
ncbi:MAG: hypothetical protein OEV42_02535 [Deltaproteobacteria bacterium]|nr:hypothetical protein [Deltaproteobacteria bacterium]